MTFRWVLKAQVDGPSRGRAKIQQNFMCDQNTHQPRKTDILNCMENPTQETKLKNTWKNWAIALLIIILVCVFSQKGLEIIRNYQSNTKNLEANEVLSIKDKKSTKSECLDNQTSLKTVDMSNWIKSVGTYDLHFEARHPANVVITRSADKLTNYTILDQSTGLSATVEVTELEQSIFKFGSKDGPLITYELNSNTFWRQDNYNEPPTKCEPTPNYTKNGYLVFKTRWGDTGYYDVTYNLILKPSTEQYKEHDGNRSIGIKIRYGWGVNEASFNSEENDKFITMLEGLIQTIILKPVSKG
jgi:hypothetical protein